MVSLLGLHPSIYFIDVDASPGWVEGLWRELVSRQKRVNERCPPPLVDPFLFIPRNF
jgi:hypothetical protein